MTLSTIAVTRQRAPELFAQTVVVIDGGSGIGLETARRARTEGANVIVTGRDPDRLRNAAQELGALAYYTPLREMDSRKRFGT